MQMDPTCLPKETVPTTRAKRRTEITIEPSHHGVDDLLGASLVDLGSAALLAEYPVCENEGERNKSGDPAIPSGRKAKLMGSERADAGGFLPNSKRVEDCAE